jgi:hypothetical protein
MGMINYHKPMLVLIKFSVTEWNIEELWYQMALRYLVIKH